jgi:hypothetical protein
MRDDFAYNYANSMPRGVDERAATRQRVPIKALMLAAPGLGRACGLDSSWARSPRTQAQRQTNLAADQTFTAARNVRYLLAEEFRRNAPDFLR